MKQSQENLGGREERLSRIPASQLEEELLDALKDVPVHHGAKMSFQERIVGIGEILDLATEYLKRSEFSLEQRGNIGGELRRLEEELKALRGASLSSEKIDREENRLKFLLDQIG